MPKSQYDEVNAKLNGKLADVLRKYRAGGVSPQGIVFLIHDDYDVTLTKSVVSRWLAKNGIA